VRKEQKNQVFEQFFVDYDVLRAERSMNVLLPQLGQSQKNDKRADAGHSLLRIRPARLYVRKPTERKHRYLCKKAD
jgi:hypothetical protein